jgi:hypothetical protein
MDPETVRLVAQCLNHYATPGGKYMYFAENVYNTRNIKTQFCCIN